MAVRALSSLQQAPIRINTNYHLLEALITLPENGKWWRELITWLDLIPNTWSISAATSIFWVIIAYVFTLADSLPDPHRVTTSAQGVGTMWLWLLPIVVGWLQVSPKCNSKLVAKAVDKANALAWVPTNTGNRLAWKDSEYPIYLASDRSTLRSDERRSPPIFNYARIWAWVQVVEEVAETFRFALQEPERPPLPPSPASTAFRPSSSTMASLKMTSVDGMLAVPPQQCWNSESLSSVTTVPFANVAPKSQRGHGTWRRILVAGCLALFLQWGTTGAAIIIVWFSPNTGLGCLSGAYILYGAISTLVWLAMLLSSILSHYAITAPLQHAFSTRAAGFLSILLRRLGKITAACNGIGLVVTSLLQFSNFFNSCWCDSAFLFWGTASWDAIKLKLGPGDITLVTYAWIASICIGAGSSVVLFVFINLYVNPAFPCPEHDH